MKILRLRSTGLIALVAYWYVFMKTLTACAQRAGWLQERGARQAWDAAETLETVSRATLIILMQEIDAVREREAPLSKAEENAFYGLKNFAAAAIMLILFAGHLKAKLAGRGTSLDWAALATAMDSGLPLLGRLAEAFEVLDPG